MWIDEQSLRALRGFVVRFFFSARGKLGPENFQRARKKSLTYKLSSFTFHIQKGGTSAMAAKKKKATTKKSSKKTTKKSKK